MLDRVRDEVRQHPDDEPGVDEDGRLRRDPLDERDALGQRLRDELGEAPLHDVRELVHAGDGLEPALLHLVDVQEGVHHPQDLGDVRLGQPEEL